MIIKKIDFSDRIDSDGDMELVITTDDNDLSMWINANEAMAIIEHLQSVFQVGV